MKVWWSIFAETCQGVDCNSVLFVLNDSQSFNYIIKQICEVLTVALANSEHSNKGSANSNSLVYSFLPFQVARFADISTDSINIFDSKKQLK